MAWKQTFFYSCLSFEAPRKVYPAFPAGCSRYARRRSKKLRILERRLRPAHHSAGRGAVTDASEAAVLRGWLAFLAGQPAEFLLINLEDLWLEPAPQNVPGTWRERPNWQRKARYSIEDMRSQAALHDLLKTIGDIRARIV